MAWRQGGYDNGAHHDHSRRQSSHTRIVPLCQGWRDGSYRLSRAWQAGVAAVRPECHSGPRAPASPGPIQPASGKERSPTGISGPKKIIARPRAKSVIITYECSQFRSEFAADSPLEEDGFELASFREGKGYGEPLQASIAVSTLTFKWLRLSCRRLRLATLGRAFRRSGTDRRYGAGGEDVATSSLHLTDGVP